MHSASVLRPHLIEQLRHPLKTISRTNTEDESTIATTTSSTTTNTPPKRAGTFPLFKHSHEEPTQQDPSRSGTPPIPTVPKANTVPLGPNHATHLSTSSTDSNNSSSSTSSDPIAAESSKSADSKTHPPVKHSPESFYAAIHEGNSKRTTVPGTGQRDRRASKTSVVDSASLLGVL